MRQGNFRAVALDAPDVLENIFPWHQEAEHVASEEGTSLSALHGLEHHVATRFFELIDDLRSPSEGRCRALNPPHIGASKNVLYVPVPVIIRDGHGYVALALRCL